jgi:hypothetical protein
MSDVKKPRPVLDHHGETEGYVQERDPISCRDCDCRNFSIGLGGNVIGCECECHDVQDGVASEPEPLLPCPFCGWDTPELVRAVVNDQRELTDSPYVRCLECGTIGPPDADGNDQRAIAIWNRRAVPPILNSRQLATDILVYVNEHMKALLEGGDKMLMIRDEVAEIIRHQFVEKL